MTTSNGQLGEWVKEVAALAMPDAVHWCTGTPDEYEHLCHGMVETGTLIRLNAEKRPNSFYCRSDPADVARLEQFTFICSARKEDAGPTNNWSDLGGHEGKSCRSFLPGRCAGGRCM